MPTAAAPEPVELAELAELAADAARAAGALVADAAVGGPRSIATKSSATDMVTEVDHASEALIVERLLSARPDDGVLGEEGSARPGTSGVRWIIDPLDGTTNFLYGYPGYNVSIAAEVDGVVAVGAVADVVHDELFVAHRGAGATRNGAPIAVSHEDDLARALVATGFGYDPERRRHQAGVLGSVIGGVRDVRRGGAAAVDLCWVACGRLDGYYEKGLAPWDLAAGSLMVVEAGGAVRSHRGRWPDTELAVAATPALIDPLHALVTGAGAHLS